MVKYTIIHYLKKCAIAIRFIISVIFTNAFIKLLTALILYHISIKINTNELQKSKKLILIYKTSIPLVNIKALIWIAWFTHLAKKWRVLEITIWTCHLSIRMSGLIHLLIFFISTIVASSWDRVIALTLAQISLQNFLLVSNT